MPDMRVYVCRPCMYADPYMHAFVWTCMIARACLVARTGAAGGGRRGEDGQLAPCRRDQGRRCPLHWRGGDLCGNRGRKVRQLWHFHMSPHEASADLIALSCSSEAVLSPGQRAVRAERERERERERDFIRIVNFSLHPCEEGQGPRTERDNMADQ